MCTPEGEQFKIQEEEVYPEHLDMGPFLTLTPAQVEAALRAWGTPGIGYIVVVKYVHQGVLRHWGDNVRRGHYKGITRAREGGGFNELGDSTSRPLTLAQALQAPHGGARVRYG